MLTLNTIKIFIMFFMLFLFANTRFCYADHDDNDDHGTRHNDYSDERRNDRDSNHHNDYSDTRRYADRDDRREGRHDERHDVRRDERHEERREGRHEERHYFRYHDHPHYGYHVQYIPDMSYAFSRGGINYFYFDGLYYNCIGEEYVVVAPPVRAVVREIPPEYHAVIINGNTYYSDNGIYYVNTPHGYEVVEPPVSQIQYVPVSPEVITRTMPAGNIPADTEESFTINVPLDNGGYAAVIIKKSGKGYVGPQGEYYSEIPKVSHLKVLYGK